MQQRNGSCIVRSLRDSVFAERVRQHRGVLVLLRSHSGQLALREGKERCIKLTTTCYMYSGPRVYYMCAIRRARSQGVGSKGSEVQVPSPGRFRYRFQHSQNRYITPSTAIYNLLLLEGERTPASRCDSSWVLVQRRAELRKHSAWKG